MKSTFRIRAGNFVSNINTMTFNGGEVNVKVPTQVALYHHKNIELQARVMDAEGVMALALIKDAIDRLVDAQVDLRLGYVPYARQDRVCNVGEALSAKVFCNMVNAMKFNTVYILDPHSDVTPALLNNVVVHTAKSSLQRSSANIREKVLVAPDAGATKKVCAIAEHFGGLEVIQGIKKRDLSTGTLSGFDYIGDVKGKDLLIVDDICDGGGTFMGLAEKLREGGAKTISLYISHGIFSKGVVCLLNPFFDKIYTTDSFVHGYEHPRLEIIDWMQ